MRINIFGGPGVGKSTISSYIFSNLKEIGVEIELVNEYIKSWAWQRKTPVSWDQMYVFAKQVHNEDIICRQGVSIVTDSPLWLQTAYMSRQKYSYVEECKMLCKKFDQNYPNTLNIVIKRNTSYKQSGRYENEKEAHFMDDLIEKILSSEAEIPFYKFTVQQKEEILVCIKEKMKIS